MSKAGHSRAAANHSHLTSIALIIAVLVAVPVLSVFSNVLTGGTGETWSHLADTVLPEYLRNTALLCVGVGLGCRASV